MIASTVEAATQDVREIIAERVGEPAPALAILHDVQTALGWLPPAALAEAARALGVSPGDLEGTVSFYHHFRTRPPEDPPVVQICDGPVCGRFDPDRTAREILGAPQPSRGGRTVRPVSCPGRCDQPVAALVDQRVLTGLPEPPSPGAARRATPLPPATGRMECLFRSIRDGKPGLAAYRARGGYASLARAARDPAGCVAELEASGLTGRGGAGFPTGRKWEVFRVAAGAVKTGGSKYVVCNADEGEPGSFKDRVLLDHDPHAVLDGMLLAGVAGRAEVGIIYLRYEYPETLAVLERAIRELQEAGLLGDDVAGTGRSFRLHVRRGAGAYVAGEETALLNSIEGKRPVPRDRPPYPTLHGLFRRPTLIGNVETFATVPPILANGAVWYRALGVAGNAGTRIYSISGDIAEPGNYELPVGTPLPHLVALAGGVPGEGRLKSVTVGGTSGGFLSGVDLSIALDDASCRRAGASLGSAGIIAYDERRCMVRAAANILRFFARESCGRCFPCRLGAPEARDILLALAAGEPRPDAAADLSRLARALEASACGLGLSASLVLGSLLRRFPDEVAAHARGGCPTGECAERST